MDNNLDQTESLCKVLFKKRHGTWDFERVGKKWFHHIGDMDLAYIIEFGRNIENSTPVRTILQKLCTEVHPPLTVRMFADSLKKINKKAYRILQPYFKKTNISCASYHRWMTFQHENEAEWSLMYWPWMKLVEGFKKWKKFSEKWGWKEPKERN